MYDMGCQQGKGKFLEVEIALDGATIYQVNEIWVL